MITSIDRDQAREEARARLPELLDMLVPNYRHDRAFTCLSPNHEDRHPSMRYLSRVNAVKCFSCGWTGDSFAVVGAVFGLTGGEVFRKTYDLLGIDTRGGQVRRQQPPKRKPANAPIENWQEIADLIYPVGWNDPKPEVKLPLPLEVTATVEAGVLGWLLDNPFDVLPVFQAGLRREHFEDAELAELYEKIMFFDDLDEYADDFLAWVRQQAIPAHMLRRSARFIIETGKRRLLESMLAKAESYHSNGNHPRWLLSGILKRALAITHEHFAIPTVDDHRLTELVAGIFERFNAGEQADAILSGFIQCKTGAA